MDVLVVGAGEMGIWFARTLREQMDDPPAVTFADTDRSTARAAAETLNGESIAIDASGAFDLVCISVPMPATEAAIETHAPKAREAVCDLAGIMAEPVRTMAEHAPDCERVSFHPLFAPANAPGNVPLVIENPGPVTERIRSALTQAGNDLFETTPDEHDEAMETVQARTHAAILAFGLAADSVDDHFHTPISSGLFDLLESVTGNDARVYADIQSAFDGADDIASGARQVAEADDETFETLFQNARPDGSDNE